MSLFFHPHESYDDVTLDDMHPSFHPPMFLPMEPLTLTPTWHWPTQWSLTFLSQLILLWFDWPLTPLLLWLRVVHHLRFMDVNSSAPMLYLMGVGVLRWRTGRWHTQWLRDWIPSIWRMTWIAHVELDARIAFLLVVLGLSFLLWHVWVAEVMMYFHDVFLWYCNLLGLFCKADSRYRTHGYFM